MAVELGLTFDLSAWRKGVRNAAGIVKQGLGDKALTPFQRGVKKTLASVKKRFISFGKVVSTALKTALGPIATLFALAAILAGIKKMLTGSLQAFRDYSDSVTKLDASLRTLNGVNVEAAKQQVKELGEQLRLSMGIKAAETNAAFSTFITRGFDLRQARQLTLLAANYAKKSGKPITDVTKQIADAANGSVDAMKKLGVEINTTGNKVRDGESAVLALKAAYGDIGSELTNPSERLAAAWNDLAISLGERISPVIEPIIQGFSDFVTGLTQTEEGKQILDGIADALKTSVDWIGKAIQFTTNLVGIIMNGSKVIYHTIREVLLDLAADFNETMMKHPFMKFLMGKLGIDMESVRTAFREMADESAKASAEAMGAWEKSMEGAMGDKSVGIFGKLNSIREQGAAAREAAAASLAAEIAATKNEGFAGNPAQQAEAAKLEQKRAAAQKQLEGRANAYGDVRSGQQVSVSIVSRRPDRFRKARLA